MCGICGILDLNGHSIPEQHLQAMSRAICHRGPDDEGSLILGPAALGFRRLSIIDVAGGHQPMANEDGTVWIVFNGEIYNSPELRPVLEERGHRYATNSDTETILHAYEEYGDDCVLHLRGMFAFAIWDTRRKRLFCARDRLGIKPFYYVTAADRFAFASEIKALLELPGLRPQLNRNALPEFFAFGYLSSEQTLFEGVRKLPPGHRLQIEFEGNDRKLQMTPYWDLHMVEPEDELSEQRYIAQFQELFADTVRVHLRSDVPVGVFLSGGLDSSAIAVEAASLRKAPIQTFSIGYKEDCYSELPYARQVAAHIKAEHNEVLLGPQDFFDSLPKLIWHEDEPLVWPSSVALFYVSRLARQRVKVVLTGEGADEILAGYLKYRLSLWNLRCAPIYRKIVPGVFQRFTESALDSGPSLDWLRRKLRHSFLYYPNSFEKLYFDNFYSVFPQDEQATLLSRDLRLELKETSAYANCMRFFSTEPRNGNLLNHLLYLDIKTYLVELLMKQDQMSMANSIESRVPFLDHKLVEFAARVPTRYKARHFSGKYLLRRAMAGRLPEAVLSRTKKGFPTPIRPWLRNQLFSQLSAVLTDGRLAARGLVQPEYVRTLLNAHRNGSSVATEGCWRLLNFELWNRIFLDREDHWSTLQESGDFKAASCVGKP